jgi:outer membrane receptor protein involved in Fe transport
MSETVLARIPQSLRRAALAACLLQAGVGPALAQGTGTIYGTVTDSSAAALPGATVEVTNTGTGLTATLVSNAQGVFSAPSLRVGVYSVTVTMDGFKKSVRQGLVLEVDARIRLDVPMALGGIEETVVVTAESSTIDATTATIGKVIESRRVQELPLNGRNALSLVLLAPTVQSGAGPTASGFGDRGTQLSLVRINGSPLATNNFLVDGLSSTNPYVPDVNINPNVDAVQEFKVQTSSMSSEYGYTLGGVVNLVTKSGTNKLHGSLYGFMRNDAWDANSWGNNRVNRAKSPLDYKQYGGSIGGPIVLPGYDGRSKSFFFYNYEGYRFETSATGLYTLPTEAFRNGDFSQLRDSQGVPIIIYDPATTRPNPNGNGFLRDPFPGNIIPANRLDPVALQYLQFYPLPNRTSDNAFSNLNNYSGEALNQRTLNQHTARLDHSFSSRNQLSVRYVYYKQFTDNGLSNLYPEEVVRLRKDPFRGHNFVVTNTHTFSSALLNEARFGLARQDFDFAAASFDGNWPSKLGYPSNVPSDLIPQVNNGLPGLNVTTVGKRGGWVYQFSDAVTWLKGRHSLKAGVQLRFTRADNLQKGTPSGNFNFSTNMTDNAAPTAGARINTGNQFATFLLGTISSGNIGSHTTESQGGNGYSFFVNDEWKVTPRVSLSLGVRYDYQDQPYERNCGSSNFDPYDVNPSNGLLGRTEYACIDYGRAIAETDTNDVAPRVGVAWDVFGNQRTVLRAGYGLFYSSLFTYWFYNFEATNGFSLTNTQYVPAGGNAFLSVGQLKDGLPSPPIPPAGSALGPNLFATSGVADYRAPEQTTPLSHQWNVSLQHQLPWGLVGELAYSANYASNLLAGNYDINQADPALVNQFGTAGQLGNLVPNPYAGLVPGSLGGSTITVAQAIRPYPYVGGIPARAPHIGYSHYNAFLASLEKRFSHGVSMLASYTYASYWSNSVLNPINFVATEGANDYGFQNGYDRDAEWSEDPSNVRHRLVISGLWEIPVGRGRAIDVQNGILNAVLGGWQLNTIATFVSGAPLVIRGASNGLADRPDTLRTPSLPDGFTDPNPERGVLWFDTTAFANPAPYTFGDTARGISEVRTPGATIIDLSLFKTIPIKNNVKLELRLEAFNAPNIVNYGRPNMSFVAGTDGLNRSDSFGRITSARDPRQFQLGLRLVF